MTIPRDDALKALIPHVGQDDIVVAVYQANFDWMVLNPRPLNYVAVGAMGQALPHGVGLAIANPERRVFVFDGDGSLLMNLGGLVTAAGAGVPNLYHVVFANRVYEVNGNHPLPNASDLDFAGFARAAGYRDAQGFDDLAEFDGAIPQILSEPGPQMISLEIVPGAQYPRDYGYIHSAAARETFETALRRRDLPDPD